MASSLSYNTLGIKHVSRLGMLALSTENELNNFLTQISKIIFRKGVN